MLPSASPQTPLPTNLCPCGFFPCFFLIDPLIKAPNVAMHKIALIVWTGSAIMGDTDPDVNFFGGFPFPPLPATRYFCQILILYLPWPKQRRPELPPFTRSLQQGKAPPPPPKLPIVHALPAMGFQARQRLKHRRVVARDSYPQLLPLTQENCSWISLSCSLPLDLFARGDRQDKTSGFRFLGFDPPPGIPSPLLFFPFIPLILFLRLWPFVILFSPPQSMVYSPRSTND